MDGDTLGKRVGELDGPVFGVDRDCACEIGGKLYVD